MPLFKLAHFRADVTPPAGSPLCAGFVPGVDSVSEPLFALGIVLLGPELPIVLCAVDWCEIRNSDHIFWREQIAQAVRTTADRVAVQCVHQHNAPIVDSDMQRLLETVPGGLASMDVGWSAAAAVRTAQAAADALQTAVPVTHIGTGQARVHDIASNRRVMNSEGKVGQVRWSACPDSALRAQPEGIIDPMLKTVTFWQNDNKLATLHFYATHPMSYYGDGIVTSDFAGMARERCVQEDGGTPRLYFTGCAGDITAGKYNSGTPEDRVRLTERLYMAMRESEQDTARLPLDSLRWQTHEALLPEYPVGNSATLYATLKNEAIAPGARIGAALELAFKERLHTQPSLPISCLTLGEKVRLLHLPGEPFIDYQLFAQRLDPEAFVAVSGYGDGGPGYIPLARSYEEGGYEPTGAFVGPDSEAILKSVIAALLA